MLQRKIKLENAKFDDLLKDTFKVRLKAIDLEEKFY